MKLTERLIAEICSKTRIAGSLETGLATCGVSREQYDAWQEEDDPLVARLLSEIASAEAEMKMVREHQLSNYFEKDWRALAWWLERKYPNEYANKPNSFKLPETNDDDDGLSALHTLLR